MKCPPRLRGSPRLSAKSPKAVNESTYQEAEDLINIGAYAKGSNPEIDQAIDRNIGIRDFLRQGVMEQADLAETLARMKQLVG